MQLAEFSKRSADQALAAAERAARAQVDLVAEARTTGVEQSTDIAISRMASGINPTYSLGLQFELPLEATQLESNLRGARLRQSASLSSLKLAMDQSREEWIAAQKGLRTAYKTWVAIESMVWFREAALRELQVSYRQGRSPLVELVRALNDSAMASGEKARAIGAYHVATARWLAARDRLVSP